MDRNTKIAIATAASLIVVATVVVLAVILSKNPSSETSSDANTFDLYTCETGAGESGGVTSYNNDATTPEECKQYCTDLGDACVSVDYMTTQSYLDERENNNNNCRIYSNDNPRLGEGGPDGRIYCKKNNAEE